MKRKIIDALRGLDHRLFFPYLSEAAAEPYYRYREIQHYPFDGSSLRNVPPAVAAYFEKCTREWPLEKFHYCYTDGCTIEPSTGWGVTKDNQLIPQSHWNSYIHRANKPWFLKFRFAPHRTIHLEKVISIQYAWGNYWHFHNDVLGQLHLADEMGLPPDTPVVIAEGLSRMAYFKEVLSRSPDLQRRNWVLQDPKTHVVCREAHFFNTFWDHRENFDAVLDYMNLRPALWEQPAAADRIFVARSRNRGRTILNMAAIEDVLRKHRFRIVECDGLSLLDQMELFRNAAYVIGIHGAGLSNVIYRQGRPMKMLEIFSADYLNPCYYWFCRQYGYDYHAVLGSGYTEPGTTVGSFTVDPAAFEERLVAMMAGSADS
jgi:hypothetical protein